VGFALSEGAKTFKVVVVADEKGRVLVPLPFDPDTVWGRKVRHHVAGTVDGMGVRGVVEDFGEVSGLLLGAAWRRDCGIAPGDPVSVLLAPEGPQRDGLPDDVAAALEAEPEAGKFFDSLAQYYRKAYLRWIDGTKRRPEIRVERIAEMVTLLNSKQKERPPTGTR
jgi:hypothetical protein